MADPQHSRSGGPAGRGPRAARRAAATGFALAACLTVTAATTAPAGADAPGLARFYGQRLDWHSCVLGPDDPERAALAEQAAMLAEAAAGRPVTPSAPTAALLHLLFGPQGSPAGSAMQAVLCADRAAPRDPEHYWRRIEGERPAHPLFGPLLDHVTPCAFWDAPREAPTEVRHGARVLILSATGDPRAPHRDGVALHRLPPGSRLLTLQGTDQHGLYGLYGNACVDDTVNAYPAAGRLPDGDPVCAQ